jgi:hypothetical protein
MFGDLIEHCPRRSAKVLVRTTGSISTPSPLFRCEADDRKSATATGRNNPFGSKLNAIFSSGIGHFDVIDMRHPLPGAYQLVEQNPPLLRGHARCECGRRGARRRANPDARRRRMV